MSKESKTPTTLLARILIKLNLTEEGKLGHFFNKVKQTLERSIKNLRHNLSTLKLQHENALTALDEQIADAAEAVEASLMEVSIDNITTNEMQTAFIDTFWSNYERSKSALVRLEESKVKLVEAYDEQVKSINEQIEELTNRIALIG